MRHQIPLLLGVLLGMAGCNRNHNDIVPETIIHENPATFTAVGQIDIGDKGAAEISAYDPVTKRLFIVNNSAGVVNENAANLIDVVDISNPAAPSKIHSISLEPYGGAVNSLSVSAGNVAAAIQATVKTDPGKVVVFNTLDYKEIKSVVVGALPDMITYTPDGRYILTANEGEPTTADYAVDPEGSISVIAVKENYAVTTLNFAAFADKRPALEAGGFRIFGKSNDFVKDIEPEYITVSPDSKTAWITLQENNGIAKMDIASKTITDIFPLGFKDYNAAGNEIDGSDEDGKIELKNWPVKGVYMPDGIAVIETGGIPYLFTANEGDAREWGDFVEAVRIKDIKLDATVFPSAAALQAKTVLGRLNITKFLGDKDGDGDYDELYAFGARSFSVWNGLTGKQVYDSKNELDQKVIEAGSYDDKRSDDKSIEPEGIAIGKIGKTPVAFVGMERVDAVAVYDISNPQQPKFLQLLKVGDAPEGVMIIAAKDSPTKRSLLVVSSEDDGMIKLFSPAS
ncbi:choice-of-anchor I family protein [Niabella sp. CC-SYL272]|uniref:choice-of-anchor I family protein n=1 Tax=Niabella agricola TaxID=2891571 RepID=UPI001F3AE0AD|nr:choice-of-anchor I family protein [Niabella agricola]MCF3110230.1 choice-of-anchor I family protein [Niabella agricola]